MSNKQQERLKQEFRAIVRELESLGLSRNDIVRDSGEVTLTQNIMNNTMMSPPRPSTITARHITAVSALLESIKNPNAPNPALLQKLMEEEEKRDKAIARLENRVNELARIIKGKKKKKKYNGA